MPAVVGAIKVITLGTSSIFHIGDVYYMQPYSEAKTFAGGGSFITGNGITIKIDESTTTIHDQDKFDQNIAGI